MANNQQRIIVYVDGFNFYFGLKAGKQKKYYWLDLVPFFQSFIRKHQELIELHYFSAIPKNSGKQDRQDLFFSANKLNPRFNLHLGKFLRKEVKCYNCNSSRYTYEEKETDVRIATAMIRDVVNDNCDATILVSADSDLIPPIDFIREFNPNHKIFIYFPPNRFSYDLKGKSDSYVNLERHREKFDKHILPNEITLPSGYKIVRPTKWS